MSHFIFQEFFIQTQKVLNICKLGSTKFNHSLQISRKLKIKTRVQLLKSSGQRNFAKKTATEANKKLFYSRKGVVKVSLVVFRQ